MIRLDTLERRNLGRGKAIEQASKVTWDELSPKERRKARQYLTRIVLPGDKNSTAGARGRVSEVRYGPHRAGDRKPYFIQQRCV